MSAVRYAEPGEVKPRVFKEDGFLWPWVAEVPFVPTGGDPWREQRAVVDRSVHKSWRGALHAALTSFPDHRPEPQ